MKIPAIKKLVEAYNIPELQAAEAALLEELPLPLEVEGEDEGEKLTHILAAIWIKHEMQREGLDFVKALRAYSARVRKSID
jgi:hypothetical protein